MLIEFRDQPVSEVLADIPVIPDIYTEGAFDLKFESSFVSFDSLRPINNLSVM